MPVHIVYETHSTTTDNEAGIATGWLPGRLSARGRLQARELGDRRCDDDIDAVFSSDLERAVQTVSIAFAGRTDIPLRQDPRLRECNYGDLNGSSQAELDRVRALHVDRPFPGGQSYREVVHATEAFLADLAAEWDGGRVLLVAHSANRWALECLLNGAPLDDVVQARTPWQPGWHYTLPAR
ncbi:histidine phosphatase family protein [Streptacidiphilus sp. PB12-B1b]|uniref:histidine phosphatase family protein n=1 Tax=Streptacidiphilus sp. PB12-B1b TaxID=2705012 RepID=UPI0015FCF287|nr:histidine phosphatase family protein [Streptacidiphilus sp. PB12-B1b]QMU75796.1 histidine phosphatase family protein [Streptacidiphilus sp. PB12-B1b]